MLHAHLTTLHVVSLILDLFAEQPELTERLLADSGIVAAGLGCTDTRITRTQELQVCANALLLRNDLGLELGRRMHITAYGMVGYAALSSATFGDAWRLMLQYPALLGTYFKLAALRHRPQELAVQRHAQGRDCQRPALRLVETARPTAGSLTPTCAISSNACLRSTA